MGPSLRTTDLVRLEGIKSFACNKIFLAYGDTSWRPDFYTVSDVLVAENNKDRILAEKAHKIFPEWVHKQLCDISDITWVRVATRQEEWPGSTVGFSRDLCCGIQGGGCTVIFDQLQMAYHMGFREVVLIGVDFSFGGMVSTGEICEQGEVLVGQGEQNHFHPDYRRRGELWTIPKMAEQEAAFRVAKKVFAEDGRRVINASRVTKLDVFERAEFDDLFPE